MSFIGNIAAAQTAIDQSAKLAEINQDEIDKYNEELRKQGVLDKTKRRTSIYNIYLNAGYEPDYVNSMLDRYGYESGGRIGGLASLLAKGDNDVSDQSKIGAGAYRGGRARAGQSIMVGEAGPEFFIPTTDAQVFSARRTEEMIMSALSRGMNGGGEGGSTIITSDNSVRSNSSTTNVVNETITPLDTITTSVISSV